MPAKGKASKIRLGVKDKGGGKFLFQLVREVFLLPVIGKVPELDPIQIPTIEIKPPLTIHLDENGNHS